jgi:hypothetical protein
MMMVLTVSLQAKACYIIIPARLCFLGGHPTSVNNSFDRIPMYINEPGKQFLQPLKVRNWLLMQTDKSIVFLDL